MIFTIAGKPAYLKEDSAIDYVVENPLFTDAEDYSLEIELPLADCEQNLAIFGNINRKDVEKGTLYYPAAIVDRKLMRRGAVVVLSVTDAMVKVQFVAGQSYRNFYPKWDELRVNEIDMGDAPAFYPDNLYSGGSGSTSRPGWATLDNTAAGDSASLYLTPREAWQRWQDYTCLPWVNNESGNVQNVVQDNNHWEWKTTADDDEDTQYTHELTPQVNLLFFVKKLFVALGYTCDFKAWENSDYRYLLLMNTLPAAWGDRKLAHRLPAWTVNEFIDKLEDFLLCRFEVDHEAQHITMQFHSDAINDGGQVELKQVIRDYSMEATKDDESNYLRTRNIEFKLLDERICKFWSCYWLFHEQLVNEGKVVPNLTYDTLDELVGDTSLKALTKTDVSPGIIYVKEVDAYFTTFVKERHKESTGHAIESLDWANYASPVPLNIFGPIIVDEDDWDSCDALEVVPVAIDETDFGLLPFIDCGTTESHADRQSHRSSGRTPNTEFVDDDVVLQFGTAWRVMEDDEHDQKAYFDTLAVAFWDGDLTFWNTKEFVPHPYVDSYEVWSKCDPPVTPTRTSTMYVYWWRVDFKDKFSLRINGGNGLLAKARAALPKVDGKRKFVFEFLADELPSVYATYIIHGKKYLCAKLTATISGHDGLSQKIKGEFYPLL